MYVAIHHTITDSQKWDETARNIMAKIEQGQLPQGLKALIYLPSVDGHKADCVWEANSVDALRSFIDRETSTAARNEYSAINAEAAIGLPGQEVVQKAA